MQNATFGNATELIVSVFALRAGLLRLIQLSLLGSILSNTLLVLGSAFLLGGFRFRTQFFDKHLVSLNTMLLLLTCCAMIISTIMVDSKVGLNATSQLRTSQWVALVVVFCYVAFIIFQLLTHKALFDAASSRRNADPWERRAANAAAIADAGEPLQPLLEAREEGEEEDDDEDDEKVLGLRGGIVWLAVVTLGVAYASEVVVRVWRLSVLCACGGGGRTYACAPLHADRYHRGRQQGHWDSIPICSNHPLAHRWQCRGAHFRTHLFAQEPHGDRSGHCDRLGYPDWHPCSSLYGPALLGYWQDPRPQPRALRAWLSPGLRPSSCGCCPGWQVQLAQGYRSHGCLFYHVHRLLAPAARGRSRQVPQPLEWRRPLTSAAAGSPNARRSADPSIEKRVVLLSFGAVFFR